MRQTLLVSAMVFLIFAASAKGQGTRTSPITWHLCNEHVGRTVSKRPRPKSQDTGKPPQGAERDGLSLCSL